MTNELFRKVLVAGAAVAALSLAACNKPAETAAEPVAPVADAAAAAVAPAAADAMAATPAEKH